MIALHILDVKQFMSKLLLNDTFDHFLLSEAVITTYNTFHIDGRLQKDYYNPDELEERGLSNTNYSSWMQLRPYCFELIKGTRTPLNFKFVFQLSPANLEKLLVQTKLPMSSSDINGLFLNLKYDGHNLSCITGTSIRIFTMDKTLEQSWDTMVQKFLRQKEIAFELL